jgi:hypothetical protein
MLRKIIVLTGFLTITLGSSAALAGVYTDDLGKCLVKSSSPKDQSKLVEWVFQAMALHPDVKPYSVITPEQRDVTNKAAAAMMERLVIVDCRKEAVEAMKYEGGSALESSFNVLGQVAMRGIMSDPSVGAGLSDFNKYFDKSKWADIGKEAGLNPPANAPAK